MSLKDKMKNWGIIEDTGEDQDSPVSQTPQPKATFGQGVPAQAAAASSVFTPSTGASFVTPSLGIVGAINQKVIEHLVGVLEQANIPGVDYYEFKKALEANKSISGVGLTEEILYKMTFGAIAQMEVGVTADKLISTGNQYLQILQKELDDYHADIENRKVTEIGDREKQIEQLKSDNEAKQQQILELSNEMQTNIDQINTLNTDITAKSGELLQKVKDFEVTYKLISDGISENLSKIQKYLVTPSATSA